MGYETIPCAFTHLLRLKISDGEGDVTVNSPSVLLIRLAELIERSSVPMKLRPVTYGIKVPAAVSITLTK